MLCKNWPFYFHQIYLHVSSGECQEEDKLLYTWYLHDGFILEDFTNHSASIKLKSCENKHFSLLFYRTDIQNANLTTCEIAMKPWKYQYLQYWLIYSILYTFVCISLSECNIKQT